MANILVIHGPNLNLLGTREPELYGADSLETIDRLLAQKAQQTGVSLQAFQSNDEGGIVDRIQLAATEQIDIVIINPAAYTHSSVAIRDAFLATRIPFVEVHLSNVHAREEFRRQSYLSDIAVGTISGFGSAGYLLALEAAIIHYRQTDKKR